jgi:hypothetical protein
LKREYYYPSEVGRRERKSEIPELHPLSEFPKGS